MVVESERLKILLVGNYKLDRQYSMINFADQLKKHLQPSRCDIRLVEPPCIVGEFPFVKNATALKWIRYLDKFILYLPRLIWQALWADVVHICDQGNALYTWFVWRKPVVVSCHDLLAARAALGENTTCYPTASGVWLQRLIIASLSRVRHLACSSNATESDVRRIIGSKAVLETIHIAAAAHFRRLPVSESEGPLPASLVPGKYILVVGNDEARKNRHGCVLAFAEFSKEWDGKLVFVGAALSPSLRQRASDVGIDSERLLSCPYVEIDDLVRLYNHAYALLFPSYAEGFGYPIVEAQACGCPVVCSDTSSLPEVAGNAALVSAPDDIQAIVAHLRALRDPSLRQLLIERGLQNVSRFNPDQMAERYLGLYQQALSSQCGPQTTEPL